MELCSVYASKPPNVTHPARKLNLFFCLLFLQETMPQTPVFSSMLGSSCSGQVQPDMGERCVDPVYQDGNLVSGSLEALIERLVPTMDYYPDVSSRRRVVVFLTPLVFLHWHLD